MTFTNENPCKYQYVDKEESFSVDIDLWLEKAIPEREMKNEMIFREQYNEDSHMKHLPVKLTKEQFEKERLLYRYYNTDKYDEEGMPIELSIEEIQKQLWEDAGLVAPKAFELVRNIFPNGTSRFAITYVDKHSSYKAHKHLHPRIMSKDGKNIREARTCVVIVPINHNAPATEKLFFNHQELGTHIEELLMDLCRWTASHYETIKGQVIDIQMPSRDQYLVVEFMSSRCVHWVENYGTENEYLCLIFEN